MEYLEKHGVRVRIVPGITAAAGRYALQESETCAANYNVYALGIGAELGIPMTHRGLATSVCFLTGHLRDNGEDPLEPLYGQGMRLAVPVGS